MEVATFVSIGWRKARTVLLLVVPSAFANSARRLATGDRAAAEVAAPKSFPVRFFRAELLLLRSLPVP